MLNTALKKVPKKNSKCVFGEVTGFDASRQNVGQLVEEHRIALIIEELQDLQLEQQQTAVEERVSEKEPE